MIPDNPFSIIYTFTLVVFGVMVWLRKKPETIALYGVLIINWILIRLIHGINPDNFTAWLILDLATMLSFVVQKNKSALACAILFFATMQTDMYSYLSGNSYESSKAIAEAIGYLCMIIVTGASYDVDGHRIYHALSPSRRFFSWLATVEARRTISSRSGMPSRNGSESHSMAKGR